MNGDLIKINRDELISYTHSNKIGLAIPKPFESEILLFDTYIARTSSIEGLMDGSIVLEKGEKLDFFREPDNKFDKNAIVIKKQSGEAVGYVPIQHNIVFSRLMDAGKELFGKISAVETRDELLKIRVKIYMTD